MPEIGTSGSMSGDGKRSVGHRPQATALILDSTRPICDIGGAAVATHSCVGMSESVSCQNMPDSLSGGVSRPRWFLRLLSPSTVSELNKKIYATIEAWRNRPAPLPFGMSAITTECGRLTV